MSFFLKNRIMNVFGYHFYLNFSSDNVWHRKNIMKDLKTEVPIWAFINAQIIQQANLNGDLDNAIKHVEKMNGFAPNSLSTMNAAYIVSLLYCLILIPQQLWLSKNENDPIFDEIGDPTCFSQISIIDKIHDKDFDQYPGFYFIKHLRNALAHVRFSLYCPLDFLFWDQWNEKSPRNFEAKMTQSNLIYFINLVGPKLANITHNGLRKSF